MTILDEAQNRAPTAALREFLRNSVSLSDLLRKVWTGRLILVVALILGFADGLWEAHRAGPLFVAMISIMPADTDSEGGGGGGGGGGAIGMLASLAGSGGASGVPKFQQFLSSIGSVGVADALNRKYDTVCVTYRGLCDPKTHAWKKRTGWRAALDTFLARVGGLPDPNGALTVVDLAQFNASAVAVTRDKVTGLTTLSYYSSDPKNASDYLMKVFRVANDHVRDQDRTRQRTYVDYVARQLANNTNIELRQALASLLLQQERRLMMSEVDLPYAATILDGPIVTPVNNVLKITLLKGFFFLLIGCVIAIFRDLVPERFRIWSRIWSRY